MTAEFKATWSRVLIARNKPDDAPLFEAAYRFEVLELAIKAFKGNFADTTEEALLALAHERLNKLRLKYAQIVGSSAVFLDPDAGGQRAPTWHDALPVGLLVLVSSDLTSVAKVEAKDASAPKELEQHWEAFGKLLTILDREIGKVTE